MGFSIGLDLGQASDFTALAVVEEASETRADGPPEKFLRLRHLERYPLRTPYPRDSGQGCSHRARRAPRLEGIQRGTMRLKRYAPQLVVDSTGVGRAVADLLKSKGLRFKAVTITGGDKVTSEGSHYRVPKRDLVAALEVSLQTETLKVAEGLDLWPALRDEMLNFRRKINLKTAHDSYEHWRDSDHDDLVLAVCLACWGAVRPKAQLWALDTFGKREPRLLFGSP